MDNSGNAYVTGDTFSSNFPTVSAYQGSSAGNRDAFVATIKTVNGEPVANAGANQSVNVGSTVTLDGSGSSDNHIEGSLKSDAKWYHKGIVK